AAIILETIQGEGGINVAPKSWLRALRAITKKHGILMIIDDIQVGCGRTGKFFSFEEAGIKPDLITLSKSIGGYGLPMSLTLIKPAIDVWKPGQHTGTFRGNNLAFVTAAEAIVKYWKDSESFEAAIETRSKLLFDTLNEVYQEHKDMIEEVRGRGLVAGIEFKHAELAGQVSKEAFSKGLIIETCGAEDNIIKFLPPLTIEMNNFKQGLKLFKYAVESIKKTPK
ncbi:MAG: aminotransferase class III-fold pyridoxal phosphate-dependent enzyme, partial [Flammeovirgaceae bacterium]